jgi:HPt (histidine-containing phosphotransfer) domain-containing protein
MAEAAPIHVERLRQTFDDDAVLAELYAMYVNDTTRRLTELRIAVDTGDLDRVCRTGHALKGSSANIGAKTMSVVAGQLESTGDDERGSISTLVRALELEFERVERFVNEFIDRAQS